MHILLFLSWPITNVHRLWNNDEPKEVDWFIMEEMSQDVQWYFFLSGQMLAPLFLIASVFVYLFFDIRSARRSMLFYMGATFLVFLMDLINYWISAGHNDSVIPIQCGIYLITGIVLLKNDSNATATKKAHRYEPLH